MSVAVASPIAATPFTPPSSNLSSPQLSNTPTGTESNKKHKGYDPNFQGPVKSVSWNMTNFFPLSYSDAARQWWTGISGSQAERLVLNLVPHIREATTNHTTPTSSLSATSSLSSLQKADPFGQRIWRSSMVPLKGRNRSLNEYSVERLGEPHEETLVMLHGYGAGLGFFYQNFEPLSRVAGWKLYALDMLGMGNSSRPNFRITAKDKQGKIKEAEDFFVDALEEWRQVRKIDKFTLMGHSLGGYLAVSYALKYPGHLNKLILASPVGIPENPYAVRADLPEPGESTMANEFTQTQSSIADNPIPPLSASASASETKPAAAAAAAKGPPARTMPGWFTWLWDSNMVSPFSIVRLGGPLGPRFVSRWTSRRFNHLPEEEAQALHTYSYNIFAQRGSGEYALTYLLAPGAYARDPIINRVQDLGRRTYQVRGTEGEDEEMKEKKKTTTTTTTTTTTEKEHGFPVIFMYGDDDWMDSKGGYAAEKKMKATAEKALRDATSPEEKRLENGKARVVIVSRAGHHLYLDNPDDFNRVVSKEMEETKEYNRRMKAGRESSG